MTQILPVEMVAAAMTGGVISSEDPSTLTAAKISPDNTDQDEDDIAHETLPECSNSGLYPQFILFGDSLTQFSNNDFQSPLQSLYIRRADIINRGFSGYTTELAWQAMQYFLPRCTPSPPSPTLLPSARATRPTAPTSSTPPIKLMTIFLGANDACLPGTPQHIPIPQYLNYLTKITTYRVLQNHNTKVILITPPPVNEHQMGSRDLRTAAHTATYAYAARTHALYNLQIPCLDLWTTLMMKSNFEPPKSITPEDIIPGSLDLPENPTLKSFLVDGLHLSKRGYDILYEELMTLIREQLPDCAPENMPFVLKEWRACLGIPPVANSNSVAVPVPASGPLISTVSSDLE